MRGLADIREAIGVIAANRTIVSMTVLAGGASLFIGNAYQGLLGATVGVHASRAASALLLLAVSGVMSGFVVRRTA